MKGTSREFNPTALTEQAFHDILEKVTAPFSAMLHKQSIDEDLSPLLKTIYIPLAAQLNALAENHKGALIVGINGAQGSGKSTLCELLTIVLQEGFGARVAGFSIDDLYLTRQQREALAVEIHPLLQTRGVPGTHDARLGIELLQRLSKETAAKSMAVPAFDKAVDDRRPERDWQLVTTPFDIILFEGWCVGTAPQAEAELIKPVNVLEADEDTDGLWRRYVNHRLATDYAELFGMLDLLVMLKIPALECVYEWRGLQERKLATATGQQDRNRIMNEAALQRFIMHYERLTRHNLQEMPSRADILLEIDPNHMIREMTYKLLPGGPS